MRWVRRLGELIGRRPAATWVKPDFYRAATERAPAPQPDTRAPAGDLDFMKIVRHVFRYGFVEVADDILFSLLVGVALGGVLYLVIPSDPMANEYARWLSYPIMVLVGVPLYICASASTPIAAALVARGVSPGAALIFLMTGPATNTGTIAIIANQFGARFASVYVAVVIAVTVALGILVDALLIAGGVTLAVNLDAAGSPAILIVEWAAARPHRPDRVAVSRRRLEEEIQQLFAGATGGTMPVLEAVTLIKASLLTIEPAGETMSAFRAVSSSQEDRERIILNAQRLMVSLIPQAHGNALYEVEQADGEAFRKVIASGAEADAIRVVAGAVRTAPEVLHTMLWREKLETALAGNRKIIVPNQDSLDRIALWKRSAAAGAETGQIHLLAQHPRDPCQPVLDGQGQSGRHPAGGELCRQRGAHQPGEILGLRIRIRQPVVRRYERVEADGGGA